MNAELARELFHQALDIADPAERVGYLQRACGDNAELFAHVQKLLVAHEQAEAVFPTEPGDEATVLAPAPLGEGAGSQIGKYKLLQQIGEGGMGVVYMAEQHVPFDKRVALKIIKLGMDTKAVVARFEAERQALALMNHPNIAKVLDAGATDTGRPYFVMELVKGMPITEYCDKQKLNTQQRLELFIPVCQAIQHAHQKGIIHRDIKPSNVLVALFDGRPVPMVIDFGIAKATNQRLTEQTVFTNLGQFIGTPAYMSPEQAEGSQLDIDTRSDIYSLGVLLYELLTGSTPFPEKRLRSAGFKEMQRIIVEEEPPRPSTRFSTMTEDEQSKLGTTHGERPGRISLLLRRELDWIVMACLEKDRNRRYETANGLAADIGRYLKGDAPEKGPRTWSYQFSKLARKHKKTFAMAAVIAVILAGAAVFSTIQWRQTREAEKIATMRAEKLAAINGWMNRDLLSQGDPWTGGDSGQRRSSDIKLRDAIVQSAERLSEQFKDHPEIEGEIRLTIASALEAMEGYEAAIEQFRRAYELLAASVGPGHTNTLQAKFLLGDMMQWVESDDDYEAAFKLMQEAYDEMIAEHGTMSPATFRTGIRLGNSYANKVRVDESDTILRRLAEWAGPLDPARTDIPYHDQLFLSRSLVFLRQMQGRLAEALRIGENLMPAVQTYYATNASLADIQSFEIHGVSLESWNPQEPALAERAYQLALKRSRAAVQESFPTSQILTRLGLLHRQQRDYTQAVDYHRQALAAAWGKEPLTEYWHLNLVLNPTAAFGNWAGAAEELRRLREELDIQDGTVLAREILLNHLAGNSEQFEALQTQFFETARTNAALRSWSEVDVLRALLALPLPSGREGELASLIERSVQKQGRKPWFERERCLDVSQGMLAFRQGDDSRAIRLLEPAVEALGENILALPPIYVLAMAHQRQEQPELAQQLYERANNLLQRPLETGWLLADGPLRWDVVAQGEALRAEAARVLGRTERFRPIKDILAEKRKPYEELQDLDQQATLEARRRKFTTARDSYAQRSDQPVFQAALAQNREQLLNRVHTLHWVLGDHDAHFKVLQAMPEGNADTATVLIGLAAISGPLPKELQARLKGTERQRLEENWADPQKWKTIHQWQQPWQQLALGMCLYREEDYERCLEVLEPLTTSTRFHLPVTAQAFSAMARWQLKTDADKAHARTLLKEADALYFQTVIEPGQGLYAPQFDGCITMEMVIKEADKLIDPDVTNAPHVAALPPEGWLPNR